MFIEADQVATVADIAKVLGRTAAEVETAAAELQMFVGEDWAGRSALTTTDAYALVSGTARRDRDHAAAQRAHHDRHEAWETGREAERRKVWLAAHDDARRAGYSNSTADAKGHDAARAALASYDRDHPEPTFQTPVQRPPWLTRIKSRVGV